MPSKLLSNIPISFVNSSLALLTPPIIACLLSTGKFVFFIVVKILSTALELIGFLISPSKSASFNNFKNFCFSSVPDLLKTFSASG